jgi:murein L,D-transpeptidase YcbB/YkuD
MIRSFFILSLFFCGLFSRSAFSQSIADQIRISLEKSTQQKPHLLGNVSLKSVADVYQFYAQREFAPIWTKESILTEQAYELRFEIKQAQYDGLNPLDYHLLYLDASLKEAERKKKSDESIDVMTLSNLEIILTDAFFALSTDLERGKINPANLKATWSIPRRANKVDYGKLLTASLEKQDVRSGLAELYPKTPIYQRGRQLMRELEERAKQDKLSWKPLKTEKSFKVGDSNPLIQEVRERLAYWGYASETESEDLKKYDSLLFNVVLKFQQEKGMVADGVLGMVTLAAMNDSPSQLMDKIAVNLERLRWIPNEFFENETIFVNIPGFQLVYRTAKDTLFTTKVIVGTVKHQSPVFTATMSYVVMSPYWNIPPSIARNETIPAIKRNPGYLERSRMEVVNSAGVAVPESSINWSARPFPYLIRQKPGPDNALGLVKFMFPNPNNVYLHDTPAKQLFDREVRTFSHGCIRMQNPKDFADLLLGPLGWSPERVKDAMNQPKEQIVNLNKKIPVVIAYLTFFVDSKGKAQFKQDVYNRDSEVLSLLKR